MVTGAQRGTNGLSSANLRGQGSAATLVLLNGRRVATHGLKGRAVDLKDHSDRGRDGITGARTRGHIGFASLRGGSVAGDHMVIFASDNERIELVHRAENRAIFANGAVKAAVWLMRQKAGRYNMQEVLGL